MAGPSALSAGASPPGAMPVAPGGQNTPPVAPSELDDAAGDEATSNVLCTILDNGDGTFTLVKGDEEEGAPALGGAGESEDGGVMPMGGDAGAPQGQTFNSPGELLKGVLDLLNEKSAPDDAMADNDLNAGFKGGSGMTAPPPKPMGM